MLKITGLSAYYGRIEALHEVSLEMGESEMIALIGSNGAGKTTLLNSISGLVTKTGEISFNEKNISRLSMKSIAGQGILQVPEGRHVFPGLTVKQNLVVGSVAWRGFGSNSLDEDLEKVFHLFPRLKERCSQLAWSLSGGEQQMLAVARAMMGRPKLLMLDEPSMGLAPIVIDELFDTIVRVNKSGIPILLVEQNAQLALEVSSRAYILEQGKISITGNSADLINDPRVQDAYLGSKSC